MGVVRPPPPDAPRRTHRRHYPGRSSCAGDRPSGELVQPGAARITDEPSLGGREMRRSTAGLRGLPPFIPPSCTRRDGTWHSAASWLDRRRLATRQSAGVWPSAVTSQDALWIESLRIDPASLILGSGVTSGVSGSGRVLRTSVIARQVRRRDRGRATLDGSAPTPVRATSAPGESPGALGRACGRRVGAAVRRLPVVGHQPADRPVPERRRNEPSVRLVQRIDDPRVGRRRTVATALRRRPTTPRSARFPRRRPDGEPLAGRDASDRRLVLHEGVGLTCCRAVRATTRAPPCRDSRATHRSPAIARPHGAVQPIDELARRRGRHHVPQRATFTYDHRSTEIVRPDQVEVLQDNDFDGDGEVDDMLTLTARHPGHSAREAHHRAARLRARRRSQASRPGSAVPDVVRRRCRRVGDPVFERRRCPLGIATGMIWPAAIVVGRAWWKRRRTHLGLPSSLAALPSSRILRPSSPGF